MNFSKVEKIIFYSLLLLAIGIVAIPKYYVTCDGPSHTYNAKVLLDFALHNGKEYYQQYYKINKTLDPNWMSQIVLASLQSFLPYWLAEKCLQISYVVLFALGLRYLLGAIHKDAVFLSCLFFPFCFSLAFQTGFYNYCLGVALLFWNLGFYWKHKKNYTSLHAIQQTILLLGATFSHGMPALLTMLVIGMDVILSAYFNNKERGVLLVESFSKVAV
jgi:hypothetical protein